MYTLEFDLNNVGASYNRIPHGVICVFVCMTETKGMEIKLNTHHVVDLPHHLDKMSTDRRKKKPPKGNSDNSRLLHIVWPDEPKPKKISLLLFCHRLWFS